MISPKHNLLVLLKALPSVCMAYTAQGKSRAANIAQVKSSVIFVMRLSPSTVYTIQTNHQCFKCFIVLINYTTVCPNKMQLFDTLTNVNR